MILSLETVAENMKIDGAEFSRTAAAERLKSRPSGKHF
jgi:hypothetical protein